MVQPSPREILALCDAWHEAVTTAEPGSLVIGESEQYRLLRNGIVFPELDHESLCAALLGLTKVLLLPGLNTVVDHDHYELWAWCGELLLSRFATQFPQSQREIVKLYRTAIHAALAGCHKPPNSEEEWQQQKKIAQMQPHHAKRLIDDSTRVLAYLAFPLLEAVLKRACSTFVTFDGTVISKFCVPKSDGTLRTYDPAKRISRCSSLRDLLVLHQSQIAEPNLVTFLNVFCGHIRVLDPSQEAYDTIYQWRNQSLHGTTNFSTISGTLLNLALAINVFEIRSDFNSHRLHTLEHCQREASFEYRRPSSFYPLF